MEDFVLGVVVFVVFAWFIIAVKAVKHEQDLRKKTNNQDVKLPVTLI